MFVFVLDNSDDYDYVVTKDQSGMQFENDPERIQVGDLVDIYNHINTVQWFVESVNNYNAKPAPPVPPLPKVPTYEVECNVDEDSETPVIIYNNDAYAIDLAAQEKLVHAKFLGSFDLKQKYRFTMRSARLVFVPDDVQLVKNLEDLTEHIINYSSITKGCPVCSKEDAIAAFDLVFTKEYKAIMEELKLIDELL